MTEKKEPAKPADPQLQFQFPEVIPMPIQRGTKAKSAKILDERRNDAVQTREGLEDW